jgi:hypothetical protein
MYLTPDTAHCFKNDEAAAVRAGSVSASAAASAVSLGGCQGSRVHYVIAPNPSLIRLGLQRRGLAPHFADPNHNIRNGSHDVVGFWPVALMAKTGDGQRDNIQLL